MRTMHNKMAAVAICIAAFAMSAVAQTVNQIPKYITSSTFGDSVITELNGNVGIGTTSPIATLDVAGVAGTQNIFTEIPAHMYSYAYQYLTLFQLSTGTGWPATTFNGTICANRSNDVGVTQCAAIYASRDYYSNIWFSEIASSIGAYAPFQLVTIPNNGATWVALLYDTHAGAGITSWSVDGTLYNGNAASVVSIADIDSSTAIHSALTYQARNTAITSGNVGIGTTAPGYKLDVAGQIHTSSGYVFPDGSIQTQAYTGTCGGDYAESVDVAGDRKSYEPGDVLVIGAESGSDVLKSAEPYSTLVAGIYSTKPGVVGRRQTTDAKTSTTEVPMAMVGIVPTKVSAENGPIKRGDLLVTSSTVGYAMKGTDRSKMLGAVVGKALGNLDSGTGVIEVLVTLQ